MDGNGCSCQSELFNPQAHADAIVQALFRQSELLAEIAGTLSTKRYRLSKMGAADTNGRLTLVFPVVPGGDNMIWEIDRWTYSAVSGQTTWTCGMYVIDSLPPQQPTPALDDQYLADWSNIVPKAVSDEFRPVVAKGGEVVAIQFQGLNSGDVGKARLQYRQTWQASD